MFCSECGAPFGKCQHSSTGYESATGRTTPAKTFLLSFLLAFVLGGFYSYLLFTLIFPAFTNSAKATLTEGLISLEIAAVAGFIAVTRITNLQFNIRRVALLLTAAAVGFGLWASEMKPPNTYAVTGQLLAGTTSGSNLHPIPGATVYFFPTTATSRMDFWKMFEVSEAGAIAQDKSMSESERCSQEFDSLVRQNTGLGGPLDAKFYPIKRLWFQIKADGRYLALDAKTKQQMQEAFWQQHVADDPEFAKLTPSELGRYRSVMLLGGDIFGRSDQALREKMETLPYVVSDSRGEFASRLPEGRQLLVAWGSDPSNMTQYLWAVPFTVKGDSRVVADEVICQPRPF